MITDFLATVLRSFRGGRDSRIDHDGWRRTSVGTLRNHAGQPVSYDNAEKLSAVWRATRVISEGVAVLPLSLRKKIDDRRTDVATSHPLHNLLHSEPNPEQTSFVWRDMMVPLQVNWGDAFAEIQRDQQGRVVALWPIHPERIPLVNRVRGPVVFDSTTYGADGSLVYLVRNDDGTVTPIERKRMLHVPGVISGDGVNGKSVLRYASEVLGIATAQDIYTGAFFKNGASPDFIVSFKNGKPPDEIIANLRASWRSEIAGAANAHRMLLLPDVSVQSMTIDPSDSQLLDSRRFSVEEIARFYGVPKNFLFSLEDANNNSLEVMNQIFLTHSLMPWLERWEQSLNQQLLSPEEKGEYFFKFNQNAYMRGDSAARSTYYKTMHGMASMSINEIRELENMSPIEGGDRYFIAANNLVPLDRIDDITNLNSQKKAPKQTTENENSASAQKLRVATCEVLKGVLTGLAQYEADRVSRHLKSETATPEKLAEFYTKFSAKFAESVRPIVESAAGLGSSTTAEQLASAHVNQSLVDLRLCSSGSVSFVDVLQGRVESEAASLFERN